jgi:polysaccharide export outer membrane protein
MASSVIRLRKPWGAAKASGLGFVFFLLTSFARGQAPPPPVAPVAQSGVASRGATAPMASAGEFKAQTSDYTVSPEDLLDVYVLDVPEITRTYRVSSNGLLSLPLLPEPIAAAGRTLDQLNQLIAAKFREAGMLNNAHVTVSLRETRLHTVVVTGEVRRPQSYPVFGPTRMLDILVQAGGLADTAGNDAIVTRGEVGARADMEESARTGVMRQQSFTLNIRKLVETGDDTTNISLYPGDRITVQKASLIYVMGAVARPGGYALNGTAQQVTVLRALAMAGDVTSVAKKKRIAILRREPGAPTGKRNEIPVDYKAALHGQVADLRLQADDILYVPESAGIKAWRTAVNSTVQAATTGGTALMIYH